MREVGVNSKALVQVLVTVLTSVQVCKIHTIVNVRAIYVSYSYDP